MRVIITGGGTGGHIYPALAIAKRIRTAIPDANILYVGSHYGLEKDILAKENISFKGIHVKPFDRKRFWRRLQAYFLVIVGLIQSFIIVKKFKPDLVIGTGGYVSGPVGLMAEWLRVDTMIHEQNAIPGMTTKKLAKRAKKVLISYKESIPYFKKSNNLFYTGVPVREEFFAYDREKARAKYGLNADDILLLSLGGSNGAALINDLSKDLIDNIAQRKNIKYIHITGKRFYDEYWQGESKSIEQQANVEVLPYCDDMPNMLLAADLVISRAGALSLAEFKAVKLPAVLIPSPNVADNHQMFNAKAFEKIGSAIVIDELKFTRKQLLDKILTIIDNPEQLKNMRDNYGDKIGENALNTIMSMIFTYSLR